MTLAVPIPPRTLATRAAWASPAPAQKTTESTARRPEDHRGLHDHRGISYGRERHARNQHTDGPQPSCTRTIGGSFTVELKATLKSVDLPVLTRVKNGFTVRHNPVLSSLNLPALATVSNFLIITNNDALASVNLPALTSVADDVEVRDNAALTSIGLPVLASAGGDFTVGDNNVLEILDAPALTKVAGNFEVAGSAPLACQARAIVQGLAEHDGGTQISDSADAAACP